MNRRLALTTAFGGFFLGHASGQSSARGRADLGPGARLDGMRVFPPDNPWNLDVTGLPVDPSSLAILGRIGLDKPLHPDFGTTYRDVPNGIPYTIVPGSQERVPVRFKYADESDPGPYPIPPDAPIEGGPDGKGDRHVLVIDRDHRKLYELFSARYDPDRRGWSAVSGAVFDLGTNDLRPSGWTSADAAGLPIFPGLARYEEAATLGIIRHALRFTVARSRRAFMRPARHFASPFRDAYLPPMGMRVRLKRSREIRGFPPQARAILSALRVYGMILADNGSDFYLNGSPDPRWDDEDLATLKRVKVGDFEVASMGDITVG